MSCGVLLLVAGLMAILAPGFTTVALGVLLGWILLFAGIGGIVAGIRSRSHHRRWTDILYGAASLLIALFILFDPLAGAATLALAFAVWLAFRGSVELGGARVARSGSLRGTLILAGVVNWLLAILLVLAWPFPAVQMLGVVVGVSLLMGGIATVAAAWQIKRFTTG
jgi:uncharacterized membrane protein HdeD (DUF308 family)